VILSVVALRGRRAVVWRPTHQPGATTTCGGGPWYLMCVTFNITTNTVLDMMYTCPEVKLEMVTFKHRSKKTSNMSLFLTLDRNCFLRALFYSPSEAKVSNELP